MRRDPANRCSLLLRNLPKTVTNDDVRYYSEKYGSVRDVYLPRDYYTGEPRGIGFVEFTNPRDAEDAKYGLDRLVISGREISCCYALQGRKRPDDFRRQPQRSSRGHGGSSRRSYSRSPRRSYSRSPRRRSRSRSPKPRRRSYSRSPRRSASREPRRSRSNSPAAPAGGASPGRSPSRGGRSPSPRAEHSPRDWDPNYRNERDER